MAKRRGKAISFDAMVKFFMQHYDIPTKKDFEKLSAKMDHLEKLIKAAKTSGRRSRVTGDRTAGRGTARSKSGATAYDRVLEVIKGFKQGAGFTDIQAGTGFDEKKIRNIIFRLNKIGKIRRKSRGLYIAK
jgi:hypothetical protein